MQIRLDSGHTHSLDFGSRVGGSASFQPRLSKRSHSATISACPRSAARFGRFAKEEFVRNQVPLVRQLGRPAAGLPANPGNDGSGFGSLQRGLLRGRHQPVADLVADGGPAVDVLGHVLGEIVEPHLAGLLVRTVALQAMGLQQRGHFLPKGSGRCACRLRGRGYGAQYEK